MDTLEECFVGIMLVVVMVCAVDGPEEEICY